MSAPIARSVRDRNDSPHFDYPAAPGTGAAGRKAAREPKLADGLNGTCAAQEGRRALDRMSALRPARFERGGGMVTNAAIGRRTAGPGRLHPQSSSDRLEGQDHG